MAENIPVSLEPVHLQRYDSNRHPTIMKPLNDSDLDQLLRAAATSATAPPGFQRDVWRMIEATAPDDWKSRVWQAIERSLAYLALPRMAIATCTAIALTGAWIGTKTSTPVPTNEVSYVQSISPFSHSHH